jgi:hypothetical protein
MLPLSGLSAERALGTSIDLGGSLGPVELNLTAFASEVRHPIGARDAMTAVPRLELVNAFYPTQTRGAEILARWHAEPFRTTLTYTYVWGREADSEFATIRSLSLVPRHQGGLVMSYEREDVMRAGLELYASSRQLLDYDSYRTFSKPYLYIGALAERAFGPAKLFVNVEILLDVRQPDWDPLVRPTIGRGGRWTNDVWAPLDGFVMNAGVRLSL